MDTRKSQGVQLRRLLAFLRPYWKSGSIILFLTLGMSALNAVEPLVQKAIFDALGGSAETLRSMSFEKFLLSAIGVLLGLMLLRELVQGVTNYLYWKLQLKTKYDLLDTAVRRIYNLSLSYHQNETVGATMTRLDRGINGFSAALFDISFNLLPSLLYLGCTIVFMFSLSWKLSIVALVFAPIPAVIG
ncbi:MAG TPA: ABC transporter transmembrane domain-containing protein, partial [Candidatus Obscuribacterales bacterium]